MGWILHPAQNTGSRKYKHLANGVVFLVLQKTTSCCLEVHNSGVAQVYRSLPVLIAVLAGALLPAQFAVNSALANSLGSVTLTGAISYLVGGVLLLCLLYSQKTHPDWSLGKTAPLWAWFGGLVGSAYVVGSVLLTQALGAALATTLVIASQVITAILLDHFGALGLTKRQINPTRAAALVLVLMALGLRLWGMQ
jgi:bacterial/archaeal transporter family-2 protein